MMQEVEVLKTIQELICSFFSEEQFTLSMFGFLLTNFTDSVNIQRDCGWSLPITIKW